MRPINSTRASILPKGGKLIIDFDETISLLHVREECLSSDEVRLSALAPLLREMILCAHEIGNDIWICSNSKFPKTIRLYLDVLLKCDSASIIPDMRIKSGRGYADSKSAILTSIVVDMDNKALALFIDDSSDNCEAALQIGLSILMAKISLEEAQRAYADYCEDPDKYYKQDRETSDAISKRRAVPFLLKPLANSKPRTRLQRAGAGLGLFLPKPTRDNTACAAAASAVKPSQTSPPIKV